MRGDRRGFKGQSISGQDAAHAGQGTIYRSLPAGDGGPINCRAVRQLLAAYRRDYWAPPDGGLLGKHLAACAECRRVEAAYREVGERVRRLPSIAPPPEFREAVFAAIRAEERRVAPAIVQLSQAATNPELPVV